MTSRQVEEAIADLEARADLAEDELTAIRNGIRELQNWLKNPVRGPIIFRSEVVEHLDQILAL
jgi:hypothetical protein